MKQTIKKPVIAVTGASGFIGARLVRMLSTSKAPPELRLISRRHTAADASVVDITNRDALVAILSGCRTVVHCAFDFQDLPANVAMANALGGACATVGARLVHVSTAAVHEPFPDGILDEDTQISAGGSAYKRIKLAIEKVLLAQVSDSGLDLVILRPTVVYGPGGRAWTDSPIRELLTGEVVLPVHGEGLCNAVYVDDVCHAVIAATTAPVTSGQRILVSGTHPVAWKDFYGAYRDLLGVGSVQLATMPTGSIARDDASSSPHSSREQMKKIIARIIGGKALSRLNLLLGYARSMVLGSRLHIPTGDKLALFQARCHVRIDKAQRLLGYQPAFDLEQGMSFTKSYVVQTYGRMARLRALRG